MPTHGSCRPLVEMSASSPDFVTVWKLAKLFDVDVDAVVDPAWFADYTVLSPNGVELAVEMKTPPRETLMDDGSPEFRQKFLFLVKQLEQERAALDLPEPGRGRIGRKNVKKRNK